MSFADLYPLWIAQARSEAKSQFDHADSMLRAFKAGDPDKPKTIYYRSVRQMRDARKQVLDLWMAQPDTLPIKE